MSEGISLDDRLSRLMIELATDARRPDGRHLWRALGQRNLLADLYGGAAGGRRDRGLRLSFGAMQSLLRSLDSQCETGSILSICVQAATAVPILSEGIADSWSEAMQAAISGATVWSVAATDSTGAGSDLAGMATSMALDGGRVVVNGEKRWVTSAAFADCFLVLARHREGRHFTNFTWIAVPAGAPGVSVERIDSPYFTGSGLSHLRMDDVTLGPDSVVGGTGRGLFLFQKHLAAERVCGALWAESIIGRTLSGTRQVLAGRPAADRSPGTDRLLVGRFGECLVEYQQLRALCRQEIPGPGHRVSPLSAMVLKASAARALARVLAECSQLHGADGYATGGIRQLQAEASLFGLAGGATETVLQGIGDHAGVLLAEA